LSPCPLNSAPIPPPPPRLKLLPNRHFYSTQEKVIGEKNSPPSPSTNVPFRGKNSKATYSPNQPTPLLPLPHFPFPIFSVSSLYPPSLPQLATPNPPRSSSPPYLLHLPPPFQHASQTPARRWSLRGICCCAAGANGWEGRKGGGRVEKGGAGCGIVVQWGSWNGRFRVILQWRGCDVVLVPGVGRERLRGL